VAKRITKPTDVRNAFADERELHSREGPLDGAGTIDLFAEIFDPDSDESDHNHDIAFGHTFIEKLLIGIIKANVHRKRNHEERLKDAMRALFDKDPTRRVKIDSVEDRQLMWMAGEKHRLEALAYHNKQPKPDVKPIDLANSAYARFDGNPKAANKEEQIVTLARKFTGSYYKEQRNPLLADQTSTQATLMYRACKHDDIAESLEYQSLRKVEEILRAFGVRIDLT
jgi:hypothetical protein